MITKLVDMLASMHRPFGQCHHHYGWRYMVWKIWQPFLKVSPPRPGSKSASTAFHLSWQKWIQRPPLKIKLLMLRTYESWNNIALTKGGQNSPIYKGWKPCKLPMVFTPDCSQQSDEGQTLRCVQSGWVLDKEHHSEIWAGAGITRMFIDLERVRVTN